MKISPALLLLFSLPVLAAFQQPPAPKTATPVPAVKQLAATPGFDEKADPKAAIKKAIDAAARDRIRVLITWGANDDKGAKLFLDAKRLPAVVSFFADEYKSVNVYVGRADVNLDLAKSYGAKLRTGALPALTVLDSAGAVIANTDASALRPANDPAGIDPAKITAFLKLHQAPAPDAVAPFEAALKQAKQEKKNVFLWFSAPW